jgi:hypothetical protein
MPQTSDERLRRIEELVHQLEDSADPETRNAAFRLMEAVLELHGLGLEKMMEIVFDTGETGNAAIRRFAGDSLVSSLLVLHGLHPDDLETRALQAVNQLHGKAELIGVFAGTVRVRLTSGGCGLKESVEASLLSAVPDASSVIVEDAVVSNAFVPLSALGMAVPGGV